MKKTSERKQGEFDVKNAESMKAKMRCGPQELPPKYAKENTMKTFTTTAIL